MNAQPDPNHAEYAVTMCPHQHPTIGQPQSRSDLRPLQPLPSTVDNHSALSGVDSSQSSSSSVVGAYPRPIPLEKRPKDSQLYRRYCLETALSNSKIGEGRDNPSASTTAPSGESLASSRGQNPLSVSTSRNVEETDLTSVISFDNNESPPSAKAASKATFKAFNGKIVKPRSRKKLSPTAKAKAALIRYLGSCSVCRSRRVRVS